MDKTKLNSIYNKYQNTTNMSFSELLQWNDNPCSKKASVNRAPIKRNLILLGTPKKAWTDWHVKEAQKMLSFEARHSVGKSGKKVKGCSISKRTIGRKNWAVDTNK